MLLDDGWPGPRLVFIVSSCGDWVMGNRAGVCKGFTRQEIRRGDRLQSYPEIGSGSGSLLYSRVGGWVGR